MSQNEIDQYLSKLRTALEKKRSQLEKIKEEIADQEMAYELKRTQAEESVRQDLVDYEGKGLGIDKTDDSSELPKITSSDILEELKTIFE